jgi:hypothetical protein
MSDGWTDTRHRHLINFLTDSPAGTYFLGYVDVSSEVANASMLADLLEKQINKIGKQHVVQVCHRQWSQLQSSRKDLDGKNPTIVLDTLCCPLLRFAVGGHWKDQGVQQLHQYGKEGVEVHLQAWQNSQSNEREDRW